MPFTVEQKVQIVLWYARGNSYQDVQNLFTVAYENYPPPSLATIRKIVNRFRTTGCVNSGHSKRHRVIPEEKEAQEILVCASVEGNSSLSSRQIADTLDVSQAMVLGTMKKYGYKSYKLQKSNTIFPEDQWRRMEFCERVMDIANRDDRFISNIIFTDESTFPLHGRHNPSVARCWAREHPHRTYNARTQYPQKLNVWAGILGDNIVGPFFINATLNGERYLELLQNQVIPALRALPGVRFEDIWFQQDGCPAHTSRLVGEYLNGIFPGRRIGGRDVDISWPPRSPDLTPSDFFLWGYVKSQIYTAEENRAIDLDGLREQILNAMQTITPEMLANVRNGFYNRLGYCLMEEGRTFEHLL